MGLAAPVDNGEQPLPNVFLVVMDTIRKDMLSGGAAAAPRQPALDSLREQSWVHPRALAPAPWTAPSHASLLTGLDPWVHGIYHRSPRRVLSPEHSTLAEQMRLAGYRTGCFAANNYIGPQTGLHRGFERWYYGGKQDWMLRGLFGPPTVGSEWLPGMRAARLAHFGLQEPVWSFINRRAKMAGKLVRLLSRRSIGSCDMLAAPWIERELERWLESVPANQPVFSFLNYMDGHEPYHGLPYVFAGSSDLSTGSLSAVRQDLWNWVIGAWRPTDQELASLRELYGLSYRVLDQRVRRLIEIIRTHHRWDNSILILTADHGQALGEGGVLFHGLKPLDSLLRVPLWIRAPKGVEIGLSPESWFSLSAIPGLVRKIALQGSRGELTRAESSLEDELTVAFADGLGGPVRRHVPPGRLRELDRPAVAGYIGTRKLILDVKTNTLSVADLDRDPLAEQPVPVQTPEVYGSLYDRLSRVAHQAFDEVTREDLLG